MLVGKKEGKASSIEKPSRGTWLPGEHFATQPGLTGLGRRKIASVP